MSEYLKASMELLKSILKEEIDERIYSAQKTVGITRTDLESDTVPNGYVGIAVGLACNFDASTTFYLKVAEKDRYENGLMAAGLSAIAVGAGVGGEITLMEFMDEGKKWVLQAIRTAGALAQNYRFRVWYVKKGSALVG